MSTKPTKEFEVSGNLDKYGAVSMCGALIIGAFIGIVLTVCVTEHLSPEEPAAKKLEADGWSANHLLRMRNQRLMTAVLELQEELDGRPTITPKPDPLEEHIDDIYLAYLVGRRGNDLAPILDGYALQAHTAHAIGRQHRRGRDEVLLSKDLLKAAVAEKLDGKVKDLTIIYEDDDGSQTTLKVCGPDGTDCSYTTKQPVKE